MIFRFIAKIFLRCINIGVVKNLDSYQKRETQILNSLVFIIHIITFITVVLVFNLFPDTNIFEKLVIPIITFLSLGLILYLNSCQKYQMAFFIFVILVNASIFFACQVYDQRSGNNVYLFLLIFCVAVFHNPNYSNKRTYIFFVITILTFLFSKKVWFTNLRHLNLSEKGLSKMSDYNQFIALIVFTILCYSIIRLINRQNAQLNNLLKKEMNTSKELCTSLKEKELLLAEIHHRVKNNLAVIISLLNLHMEKKEIGEEKVIMQDLKTKIMSMNLIHTNLYQNKDISRIKLKNYLEELSNELLFSYAYKINNLAFEIELEDIDVDISKATPIGLIVTELLTNSLKHAFNSPISPPLLSLKLFTKDKRIHILVSDNGPGYQKDHIRSSSLGLELIKGLVDQVDGKVMYSYKQGASTELII